MPSPWPSSRRAPTRDNGRVSDPDGDPNRSTDGLLPKPPFRVLSAALMAYYVGVFAEALTVVRERLSADGELEQPTPLLCRSLNHLCAVYCVEMALAVYAGWCAMAGGWTRSEIWLHHGLYVVAVQLNLQLGCFARWADAGTVSLLTAANEAALVYVGLGAPAWVSSGRRLFGFSIILCARRPRAGQRARGRALLSLAGGPR